MKRSARNFGLTLATGAALLLGGCVTPGGYGPNGGYGQPAGYPSQQYPSQYGATEGMVEGVDPQSGRIAVLARDPRNGREVLMELRFDQRTRLTYQGREAAVSGLERGDVIRFDATPAGGELYVRHIEVVRNVREGGYGGAYGNDGSPYGGGGNYGPGGDFRGAVTYVDPRTRTIRLDGGNYGNAVQVTYDARTSVEYQGRAYRPEDLERGDHVRIQARQVGPSQWRAERIIVERSVRG